METTAVVSGVLALVQAGTTTDSNLIAAISDPQDQIAAAVAALNSQPYSSSLSGQLAGYDFSGFPSLVTQVQDTMSNLVQRIDLFTANLNVTGNDPATDLSTAFGALLGARSFVAAVSDITTNIADDTTDGVTNRTARVAQLAAFPASIAGLVAGETTYTTNGQALLASYSDALRLVQAFNDVTLKAVIGAAGSDILLSTLRPEITANAVASYTPPSVADPTP